MLNPASQLEDSSEQYCPATLARQQKLIDEIEKTIGEEGCKRQVIEEKVVKMTKKTDLFEGWRRGTKADAPVPFRLYTRSR
jgi:hypothetical protein